MTARRVDVGGGYLQVAERGPADALPVLCLPGEEGPDAALGGTLDPLADDYRLMLVEQPAGAPLEQLADEVSRLAASLGLTHYAVLGDSAGALVALQHACDAPGAAVATVVSGTPPLDELGGLVDRLRVVPQPVLAISAPDGARSAELVAERVRHGERLVAPAEPAVYLATVRDFLTRHAAEHAGTHGPGTHM